MQLEGVFGETPSDLVTPLAGAGAGAGHAAPWDGPLSTPGPAPPFSSGYTSRHSELSEVPENEPLLESIDEGSALGR